ncbi:LacI family DNA-binding transcriptional regulator [Adhaeribacter rhizoryzae]|uniref:LacI family transcriptional regulator n=1 Tax=Adhaeribacter rhizoryzae TaxID=2607907 RepID=A0A5M6D405_9BACT|nr:LacI family DNA-binding transcriptional regulator [Adhaeribacter rhizoryzae]KAA5541596.1 LacI family transcriptional regulator [Adhaeribacter rhizoryzae]
MNKIDIKTLAKELNVSPATITRAFRGYSDINPETKERILALAKKLNYHPNYYASNLRETKSKTIAVIIPQLRDIFFSLAIDGLESLANQKGYHILIYRTENQYEKEVSFINYLQNGRVDGIIMSGCAEAQDHKYLHQLQKRNIPVVFFDRIYDDVKAPKVSTDDYESSYKATKLLAERGCKKIAHLGYKNARSIGKTRMEGYQDALKDFGLPVDEQLIINCLDDNEQNYACISLAIKSLKPDGIFAAGENLAFISYKICHELQIKIPDALKIISYSSSEVADLLNPSLTTITQPALEIGNKAAMLLFQILEGESQAVENQIILQSELIERESTRMR